MPSVKLGMLTGLVSRYSRSREIADERICTATPARDTPCITGLNGRHEGKGMIVTTRDPHTAIRFIRQWHPAKKRTAFIASLTDQTARCKVAGIEAAAAVDILDISCVSFQFDDL